MHHDHAADGARTQSPTCGRAVFALSIRVQVLNIKTFGKICPKIVTRPRLQCFAITHHRFDWICVIGSCKFLFIRLPPFNNRQGHEVFGKPSIDAKHANRFFLGIFIRGMCGVTFLPKKFRCSQEQARPHFPSNDGAPLINKQRQVTPRLDPIPVSVPNDRFRGRTDDQLFLEFCVWVDH